MAIYRIYPQKDTIIWSESNLVGSYGNAGKDEILEIGTYKDINDTHRIQRTLIQFNNNQIQSTLTSKVTGNWSSSLHLYLADAGELPQSYVIEALAVSSSWTEGTGKRDDLPLDKTGVTWEHREAQTSPWNTAGGDFITNTATFISKISSLPALP